MITVQQRFYIRYRRINNGDVQGRVQVLFRESSGMP